MAGGEQALEDVDVLARQLNVLAARFDGLLDIGAFAELVPRLHGQQVATAQDGLLELTFVARASLAVDVEAVPLGSASAVLRILEARPDLGDGQLRSSVEAEWRSAP